MRDSEAREQHASKWNRASYWRELTSAKHKIDEIEPLIGTKTYISQKSASTTLRCFTGYHFNAHKSRHCSGSTTFQTFSEKRHTGTATPIEVLENKAFQHFDVSTCGSAVPDQVSDLALVRGSDDGSVQSPNSLKIPHPNRKVVKRCLIAWCLLSCLNTLSWCLVLLSCLNTLSWYLVFLHGINIFTIPLQYCCNTFVMPL